MKFSTEFFQSYCNKWYFPRNCVKTSILLQFSQDFNSRFLVSWSWHFRVRKKVKIWLVPKQNCQDGGGICVIFCKQCKHFMFISNHITNSRNFYEEQNCRKSENTYLYKSQNLGSWWWEKLYYANFTDFLIQDCKLKIIKIHMISVLLQRN